VAPIVDDAIPGTAPWPRAGTIDVPALRIGDKFVLNLANTNHATAWSRLVVTVEPRSVVPDVLDHTGEPVTGGAVLRIRGGDVYEEEWVVLGPDGTFVATVHGGPSGWPGRSITYPSPSPTQSDLERALLFLGLAGQSISSAELTGWSAYGSAWEVFANQSATTTLVTRQEVMHYGVYGGARTNFTYGYTYDGLPVPRQVHNLRVGAAQQPELIAAVEAWTTGPGPALAFALPTSSPPAALPQASVPDLLIESPPLPILLDLEASQRAVLGDPGFAEWSYGRQGIYIGSAWYLEAYYDGQGDPHPRWSFTYRDDKGASLWAQVVLQDQRPAIERLEGSSSSKSWEPSDPSRLARVVSPLEALARAMEWVLGPVVLQGIEIYNGERNGDYIWPLDWPLEARKEGQAVICLVFRPADTPPAWDGVDTVRLDLMTGNALSLTQRGDNTSC
jgi:hypothetical protein